MQDAQNPAPVDQEGIPLAASEAPPATVDEIAATVPEVQPAVLMTAQDHLAAAKRILTLADQRSASQNAKDAIQNINYALAACERGGV